MDSCVMRAKTSKPVKPGKKAVSKKAISKKVSAKKAEKTVKKAHAKNPAPRPKKRSAKTKQRPQPQESKTTDFVNAHSITLAVMVAAGAILYFLCIMPQGNGLSIVGGVLENAKTETGVANGNFIIPLFAIASVLAVLLSFRGRRS